MAATETSTRANAAVDDLYRRHVGDVYRYTYAVLGNHADAEDVTQTTFVNALRALERGESPRNGSAWLIAIAQNVVRQRWRQAAARPAEVELVQDVPDAPAEDDVEIDELVRALQRIPPAQREALVMRELEGRSYAEISELLGLTTSALETLLFRARRSLADELDNLVTCQNAELAMSKQLDGRLSRKERRRLDEHLAECPDCARLAQAQKRQRRAFKGLAVLPVPVGLALFKGVPSASAATGIPTIGLAASGGETTGTVGAAAAGSGGTAAGVGVAVAEGSLLGLAAKVAAVVVAGLVATGVGYKGVQALRDGSSTMTAPADQSKATASIDGTPAGAPAARGTTPRGDRAAVSSASAAVAAASARRAGLAAPGTDDETSAAGRAGGARATEPVTGGPSTSQPGTGDAPAAAPDNTPGGETPKADKPKPKPKSPGSTPAAPKPKPAPPAASPTPGTPPAAGAGPSGTAGSASQPGSTQPDPGSASGAPAPPASGGTGTGGGTAESPGTGGTPADPAVPCPGGGDGPGNGLGCGIGNAYGQDKGKGP